MSGHLRGSNSSAARPVVAIAVAFISVVGTRSFGCADASIDLVSGN